MPLYEYYCADCQTKFDALRPMSQADTPIACKVCSGTNTARTISLFSVFSKGSGGVVRPVAGSNPCGSCHSSACSTCSHR